MPKNMTLETLEALRANRRVNIFEAICEGVDYLRGWFKTYPFDQYGADGSLYGESSEERPLIFALKNGRAGSHIDVFKCLLEQGLDPNQVNDKARNGNTPLIEAARARRSDVIDLLIRYGAKVNQTNHAHRTALICSSLKGDLEAVKQLIRAGADIHAQDSSGYTSLMWAISGGHHAIVVHLVESGARILEKNSDGEDAIDVAKAQYVVNPETVYYLEGVQKARTEQEALEKAVPSQSSGDADTMNHTPLTPRQVRSL